MVICLVHGYLLGTRLHTYSVSNTLNLLPIPFVFASPIGISYVNIMLTTIWQKWEWKCLLMLSQHNVQVFILYMYIITLQYILYSCIRVHKMWREFEEYFNNGLEKTVKALERNKRSSFTPFPIIILYYIRWYILIYLRYLTRDWIPSLLSLGDGGTDWIQ